MEKETLDKFLELHENWVESDGIKGQQANLNGANLNGANLNRASLNRANLNGASLNRASLNRANLDGANLDGASLDDDFVLTSSNCRYLKLSDYYCWIFESEKGLVLKIGCECHLVEEWRNYTDERIIAMDSKRALKFWRKEKTILMLVCESMKKEM